MDDPGKSTGETIRLARRGCNAVAPGTLAGVDLEQSRRAHAAADAHRHEPSAAAALAELVDELRRELRARRAERMTERDRAAVDVHFLLRNPELAHDRDDLRRERLVELDQVDVVRASCPRA